MPRRDWWEQVALRLGRLNWHTGNVAVVLINRRRRARVERQRVAYWTWEERQVGSLRELEALAARTDLTDRVLRLRVAIRPIESNCSSSSFRGSKRSSPSPQ